MFVCEAVEQLIVTNLDNRHISSQESYKPSQSIAKKTYNNAFQMQVLMASDASVYFSNYLLL